MPIAEQLRAAGLLVFPCWVRFDPAKNKWDKGPSVPKGESWKLTSYRPINDPALNWSSGVVGLPIPPRILVLDVDSYKGANRADIEAWLGAPLDWERALIQRTIGGGEHYAFRCDWEARQLQNDENAPRGVDTRAAGRGFICTGQGYEPVGLGVYAMLHPDALPALPESARPVLEVVAAPPAPPVEHVETDVEQIIEALRHIDPAGDPQSPRASWLRVLMALKQHFKDEDYVGQDIAERWSAGEFWPGGTPDNYVPEHVPHQWGSIKAEGGVTIATLFYKALQAGWTPPATFDTAMAFGAAAAPGDVFVALVERVQESGGDVKQTATIVDEIRQAGCNALQVALLAAELKNALRDAGIKDKAVTGHVDKLLATELPDMFDRPPAGTYGKNDTDNAAVFLDKYYPAHGLVRCDGAFFRYTGKAWERVTIDTLKSQVYSDMARYRMQENRMSACYRTASNIVPTYDGKLNKVADTLIVFDNGVLDLTTGQLHPHDPGLFTTNIMPYAWDPAALCVQWLAFLADIFNGDQERIDLLQEWFGYLLTRRYDHQKIMFLLGGPRCGKGTIGRILHYLVGAQNFSGGSLSSLANDSYIDGLTTKTVVFIGDAQKKVSANKVNEVIERLKAISGNDEVSWHRMYYGALSETLPARFTLAANNVPSLFDDSGALASRMLLLTFDKSYLGREDLTLGDRLSSEIGGIASWALQGLRRLSLNGRFTEPAASLQELADLREQYSPLLRFLSDRCALVPGAQCKAQDLYDAYRNWCLSEQEELLRPKVFVGAIKDATRGRGVRYGQYEFDGEPARGFAGVYPTEAPPATAGAFKARLVK